MSLAAVVELIARFLQPVIECCPKWVSLALGVVSRRLMDWHVIMLKPPRIESAEAIGQTRLHITWTTGERLAVDLAEPINRLNALAPLRDPAVFARVHVGEWGHSLVWDEEIDLGADRLYKRCCDSRLSPM